MFIALLAVSTTEGQDSGQGQRTRVTAQEAVRMQ
jgi:hypothetical protein